MSRGQSVALTGLQTGSLWTPHVVHSSAVGPPTSCLKVAAGIQIQILGQVWFCPVPAGGVGEGPGCVQGDVTISASCSPQCVRKDVAPPCVEWWKL